jgi:hypothetical protein
MSGKSIAYVDKDGKAITSLEWGTKRSNGDYYKIRQYEGEKLAIHVEWIGRVKNANIQPKEYWKPFDVKFSNIIIAGDRPGTYHRKHVPDVLLTKSFATEDFAVQYYIGLLMDRGLAEIQEDYEGVETVVEIGNKFVNKGTVAQSISLGKKEVKTNKIFGSW